jgi:hypothetical protein
MAWTRLTEKQANYASTILDAWDGPKPAILDRRTITFANAEDRAVFVRALCDEITQDRSKAVPTTTAHALLGKVVRLEVI